MTIKLFENIINEAWENKNQVNSKSTRKLLNAISKTIDLLDDGKIRVAEKKNNEWIVGCNYLPSNAINQLEMFQSDTYDAEMNLRELTWAKELGFNSVRVYLHDLLWEDSINFKRNLNSFLDICDSLDIRPMLVLCTMFLYSNSNCHIFSIFFIFFIFKSD